MELIPQVISRDIDVSVDTLSDSVLSTALCQSLAVFSFTLDGNKMFPVECLVPLQRVCTSCPKNESIIVQAVDSGTLSFQFANLDIALVRDCLLANAVETLGSACTRPQWLVTKEDLYRWFDLYHLSTPDCTGQWQLLRGPIDGQLLIGGLSQRVNLRRGSPIPVPLAVVHPWQAEPPLPSLVEIDLSNHYTKQRWMAHISTQC